LVPAKVGVGGIEAAPIPEITGHRNIRANELKRPIDIKSRVSGLVDLGHTTHPERFGDVVRADDGADQTRHSQSLSPSGILAQPDALLTPAIDEIDTEYWGHGAVPRTYDASFNRLAVGWSGFLQPGFSFPSRRLPMNLRGSERKARENQVTHNVAFPEAIDIFDDELSSTFPDPDHSAGGSRYPIFGKSSRNGYLVVSYRERGAAIRFISARPMTRSEIRASAQ
jgi:uncharacterized protein